MKSPVSIVKDKFGDKAKLVEAVKTLADGDLWLGRTSGDRGGSRGLEHVSNAKLLRLHAVFTSVKAKFQTREKLIDAIITAHGRTKDADYKKSFAEYPVPRLWDMYNAGVKRAKAAATKAAATKPAAE